MEEAKRFDSGKLNLLNIHPVVLSHVFSELKDNYIFNYMNNSMVNFFFYGAVLKPDNINTISNIINIACPVLDFGASKYGSLNYTKGMAYSRVMKSFLRHAYAVSNNVNLDDESGLPHLSHMACNYLFMYTYECLKLKNFDDRKDYCLGESNELEKT